MLFFPRGYTGYVNVVHVKPSITVSPAPKLSIMGAIGLQWQTTADAIYVQPNNAIQGTAGRGGRWTGLYGQLWVHYVFNANLTGAVEAVHYLVGEALRRAGCHDSSYLGIELKFGW
jgi:hypothetical protein